MKWIIYLIEHNESSMKYVGITSRTMSIRWKEHYNNRNCTLYEILRSDGHMMTMKQIGEADTEQMAIKKEQQFIQDLRTYEPHGWNRLVYTPKEEPVTTRKKWKQVEGEFYCKLFNGIGDVFECPSPSCSSLNTSTQNVEVFNRKEDDVNEFHALIMSQTAIINNVTQENSSMYHPFPKDYKLGNPSPRRQGIRIFFKCESCHSVNVDIYTQAQYAINPPDFELLIYQHKGNTILKTVYYIEDES